MGMDWIKRHSGWIFFIVLAAVGAFMVFRPTPPPKIQMEKVAQGDVVRVLALNGRVRAIEQVDLKPRRAGILGQVSKDEGDIVEAGEVLAVVQSPQQEAQLRAAEQSVQAKALELKQAQRDLKRVQELRSGGYATIQRVDDLKLAVATASADYLRLKASVDAARSVLEDAQILAPFDGIILRRPVDGGTTVATDQTVFTIAAMRGRDIEAEADEVYADALRVGLPVKIKPAGQSSLIYDGRLTYVAPNVNTASGGRLIRVSYDGVEDLPPGLSVDVTIIVDRENAVLNLPRAAILTPREQPSVMVVDASGQVMQKPVTILDWPAERVIVRSGVSAGMLVVANPRLVKPGQIITPLPPQPKRP